MHSDFERFKQIYHIQIPQLDILFILISFVTFFFDIKANIWTLFWASIPNLLLENEFSKKLYDLQITSLQNFNLQGRRLTKVQ